MITRQYQRFTVTGTKKLDGGGERSWTERGLCLEEQDPLQIALSRNNALLSCSYYTIHTEKAFSQKIEIERQAEALEAMRRRAEARRTNYIRMENRWDWAEWEM